METPKEQYTPPLVVPELLDKMVRYRSMVQDQPRDRDETDEDVHVRAGQFYAAEIENGGYTPQQIAMANSIVFSESDATFYGTSS